MLISGEGGPILDNVAEKMLIQNVVKGCRDKAVALKEFSAMANISLKEICFMGDDINDLPAMHIVGVSAAPANATQDVIAAAEFLTIRSGGGGAVREIVEAILKAKGLNLQEVLARM